MVAWLKFYFLSFFSNKISKEGATRRIGNLILSLVLAFAVVCCGVIAGYAASFDKHYDSSPMFREFLCSAFADGERSIELTVADGKLSAVIPSGELYIDGFDEEVSCSYNQSGYTLIVDTRTDLKAEQKNKYTEKAYKDGSQKYLILLCDAFFCSFTTSSGVAVEFAGDYLKFSNGKINADGASVDMLVDNLFNGSMATETMIYFISALQVAILYFGALLVLALIAYLIVRHLKCEWCGTYTEMLKIVGSYLFISSLLSFLFALAMSFCTSSGLVFTLAGVAFIVVALIRTAVLVIPEIITAVKNKNKPDDRNIDMPNDTLTPIIDRERNSDSLN